MGAGTWVLRSILAETGAARILTISVLGLSLVAALPAAALIIYLDRREPETPGLLVLAFLWGGLASAGLAVVLNGFFNQAVSRWFNESAGLADTSRLGYQLLDDSDLLAWLQNALVAPYIEEALKAVALVVLVLLARSEMTSMRDGIVYGALVGLGFAVIEATVFTMQDYATTGTVDYAAELVPRFVLGGVNGHALYTALFGAGLGWIRQSHQRVVHGVLVVVGAYLLAVAAHAGANAFAPIALGNFASLFGFDPNAITVAELWFLEMIATLAVSAWVYVVLAFLVVVSGYWELDVCRQELADETDPTISPREYELLESESLFKLRRVPGLSRRQSARLVRAQNELAFRRHDVRRVGGDPRTDPLTDQWRVTVAALRTAGHIT